MRKTLTLLLLIASYNLSSQNLVREELNMEELEYLSKNLGGGVFKAEQKDYDAATKNNLVNYEYEIIYNEQVIYRGTIKKPGIAGLSEGMNRTNGVFCLEYDLFDTETKLELTENQKIKLSESETGKKYFWADRFEFFPRPSYPAKKFTVNDKIAENIKIKFYKTYY
ncbi:hypothetical protein MAR621_03767 [Maribacter dokdonensis]|uniref:hypothetical protein n=1 Tax=Maribacter dokdonensis TaxID=320912 RepID=UPI001B0C0E36|nr:hypothetical protein [Maribacter dokdonensis]CAG2533901.1 hypothetical protein MAR621_03767 [Maribacter dokdonensis]